MHHHGLKFYATHPPHIPLTPLLTTTQLPFLISPVLTSPSLASPFSSAHLRVVPRCPPLSTAGVTHSPPLNTKTLVKLPSMTSCFSFHSSTSFFSAKFWIQARVLASSYIFLAVVLNDVKDDGAVGASSRTIFQSSAGLRLAGAVGNSSGNNCSNGTAGIAVTSTVNPPSRVRIGFSYPPYQSVLFPLPDKAGCGTGHLQRPIPSAPALVYSFVEPLRKRVEIPKHRYSGRRIREVLSRGQHAVAVVG
jgi:hypothetical protein